MNWPQFIHCTHFREVLGDKWSPLKIEPFINVNQILFYHKEKTNYVITTKFGTKAVKGNNDSDYRYKGLYKIEFLVDPKYNHVLENNPILDKLDRILVELQFNPDFGTKIIELSNNFKNATTFPKN